MILASTKDCVESVLRDGPWLAKFFGTENSMPPMLTSKYGLDEYSRIGGSLDLEAVSIFLILLGTILAIRYWGTWIVVGKFPRRFP